MHIDLVITELEAGGAERCFAELAGFLKNHGHQVRAISIASLPKSDNPVLDRLRQSGIAPISLQANRVTQLPKAIGTFRRLIQQDRPAIIQSFLFHANVLTSLATIGQGIGSGDSRQPKLVAGVRVLDPRRWRSVVERQSLRRFANVVCVSQSIAEYYVEHNIALREKVVVIPNGIVISEPRQVQWSDLGVPNEVPVVLFVGRLDQQKGIDQLPQIAKLIFESSLESHLVVIGNGPLEESLRSGLENSLNESQRERIHLIPWRADARDWIAKCVLLLLPSRWEGMPNVILEAMAAGRPVVSTRAHGVVELLGENSSQQTVAIEDWNGIGNLVVNLLNSSDDRKMLGDANRQRAAQHFQLESLLQRYEDLYLSLLAGPE